MIRSRCAHAARAIHNLPRVELVRLGGINDGLISVNVVVVGFIYKPGVGIVGLVGYLLLPSVSVIAASQIEVSDAAARTARGNVRASYRAKVVVVLHR